MPVTPDDVTFRPVTAGDFGLVHRWLNTPHGRRWYGGGSTLAEVVTAHGPAASQQTFLLQVEGRAVGFLEWGSYGDFPAIQRAFHVEDPTDVNVDVLIGEADHLHRGLGPVAIRAFLERVVSSGTPWKRCIIDPDPDNAVAIRAYEKAGFRFVRAVADDSKGHAAYLMELRREELHPPVVDEDFHLRPARGSEADLATEIDDDACTLYAEAGLVFDPTRVPEFFVHESAAWAQAAHEGRMLFACTRAGEPVAFAAFGFVDGAPFLHQLSARREVMGRGLGRRLLERVWRWSVRSGVLWLTTYDHVPWNRPFYERHGFQPVDEDGWGPELRAIADGEHRALPAPEHRIAMRRLTSPS